MDSLDQSEASSDRFFLTIVPPCLLGVIFTQHDHSIKLYKSINGYKYFETTWGKYYANPQQPHVLFLRYFQRESCVALPNTTL